MISWGLLSAAMAMVQGKTSFIIVRFLLGAAEAGFFPGIILYLTCWFPARYRAAIVSRFMFAIPVSLLIGAPVSGLILNMNGVFGIAGWKWLFIFEGIPSVVLGFITFFYLTDTPAKAGWLEPNERQWLQAQLDHERASVESVHKFTLGQALLNLRVLVLGLVYFTLQIGIYGVKMWLRQIIKRFGNLTTLQIGLIAAIPFTAAGIGMLVWGNSSDKKLERKWHLTVAFLCGLFRIAWQRTIQPKPSTDDHVALAIEYRALCGNAGILDCSSYILDGNCRGGRHCSNQLDRESRRIRRPVYGWVDQRCDR